MRLQLRDRLDAVAIDQPVPPVRRSDLALTAVLALVAIVFVVGDDALPLWARVIPALVSLGFVPFRRRIPLTAVATFSIVLAACVAVAVRGTTITDVGSPAGLADAVLFYSLCRWSTPLRIGIGFAVSLACEAIILSASSGLDTTDWRLVLPWFVVAGFALAMRYRARAIAIRHDQVRLAERHSLARELHDTVAHHMTAIAVQAQAGQYVVSANPTAAADTLRSIETIANQSIDEMRRMVGILRSEDERTRTLAPGSLDALVHNNGQPLVQVSGDAELDGLPTAVGGALFRIAQESITNARRHSRDVTFVDIAVERHPDRVEMLIDNDGTPTTRNSGSGFGQIGMRERAEALGGTFESAARLPRGWRTRTSIPLARVDR